MANVKITELSSATTLGSTDVFPVVDVGSTQTKKVTITDLLRNTPDGTAAAPSIANAGDQDTGIYFPAENNVGVSTGGTQRLVIDSSGNVGVGDSSPSEKLSVAGKISFIGTESAFGNSSQPTIYRSGSTAGSYPFNNFGHLIIQPRADGDPRDIVFATGNTGANKTVIDSSGRLLVGTSTSLAGGNKSIQLVDTGVVRTIMGRDDSTVSAGTAIGSFDWYGNGGDGSTWEEVASIEAEADGSHATGDKPGRLVFSTTADNASSSTERMRIDSSGRVGIGTASPSEKLEVQSSTNTTIRIDNEDDSTATLVFHNTGSTDRQISVNSGSMRFGGSSDEQMRIDSSGRLLVGTTTEGAANADDLTLATTGHTGITIRSGTSSNGNIYFSDATSGTGEYSGYLQYRHDDNALAFGTLSSERLRIDSSGNIGIGTTSPFRSVHVSGSSDQYVRITSTNSANAGIEFGDSDDPGRANLIYSNSADSMLFTVNGSERARIDSDGRLLMGSSVAGNADADNINVAGAGNVGITFRGSSSGTGNIFFADSTSGDDLKRGQVVYDHSGNSMRLHTNAVERLRVDSSGRVGIGTTSPTTILHIEDDISGASLIRNKNTSTDASSASGVRFDTASDGTDRERARIVSSDDGANKGYLAFETRSTSLQERVRIDSSGKVLIAKTSSNFANAGIELRENGEIVATRSAGDVITTRRLVSEGTHFSFRNISATAVGTIVTTSSSTAYNTSSDYRLKENVVDIADGITRVKQLQPRRFNFIADDTTTVDGFLAHEAQTVVPEAVTGTHNEVDDDGNPVMQGIDQSKLVPLLTAALQESIAKIETLEAKVAALEAQ